VLFFVWSGDVDFWVNGGWDQPNCGVVVNPLAILQFDGDEGIEGKNYIVQFQYIYIYNVGMCVLNLSLPTWFVLTTD
jgi:hypothetical protein